MSFCSAYAQIHKQKQGHNCVNLPQIYTENRDPKILRGPYRYLVPKIETLLWHLSGERNLKYGVFL